MFTIFIDMGDRFNYFKSQATELSEAQQEALTLAFMGKDIYVIDCEKQDTYLTRYPYVGWEKRAGTNEYFCKNA